MGDDKLRASRSRDPVPREVIEQTSREHIDDPLVGLARLATQQDANGGRHEMHSPPREASAPGEVPSEQRQQGDRRYVAALSTGRPKSKAPIPGRCSRTALKRSFRKADLIRSRVELRPASPDDQTSNLRARRAPILPAAPDARDNRDIQVAAIGGAYGADRYHEDARRPRWRGSRAAVATVLAVAVLGTGGLFAYRALFGGFPAPSFVKLSTGLTNTAENNSENARSNSSHTSMMSRGSSETLVVREQQPIDSREAPQTVPRIISTIPVASRVSDAPAAAPAPAAVTLLAPAPADIAPAPSAVLPSAVESDIAQAVPPPVSAPIPVPSSSQPKEAAVDGELARAPDPAPAVDAPAASAVDSEEARSVPPLASAPMPLPDSTEPKHIPAFVGSARQVDANTSSRPAFSRHGATRTAARPSGRATRPVGKHDAQADATPSSWSLSRLLARREAAGETSSGGYSVQVTSQHSAAAAHASFRTLQAKFPDQLGGREPIVRRANLGAKGIYYRAMVGTFSSMEKAEGMCKTLKAAGGNCVIQRD